MLNDIMTSIIKRRGILLQLRWHEQHQEWLATLHDAKGIPVAHAFDAETEKAVGLALFQFLLSTQNDMALNHLRDIFISVADEPLVGMNE